MHLIISEREIHVPIATYWHFFIWFPDQQAQEMITYYILIMWLPSRVICLRWTTHPSIWTCDLQCVRWILRNLASLFFFFYTHIHTHTQIISWFLITDRSETLSSQCRAVGDKTTHSSHRKRLQSNPINFRNVLHSLHYCSFSGWGATVTSEAHRSNTVVVSHCVKLGWSDICVTVKLQLTAKWQQKKANDWRDNGAINNQLLWTRRYN